MSINTKRKRLYYLASGLYKHFEDRDDVKNIQVFSQDNEYLGNFTGFTSRPTYKSNGHMNIIKDNINYWIDGEGVYIPGFGIKMVSEVIFENKNKNQIENNLIKFKELDILD